MSENAELSAKPPVEKVEKVDRADDISPQPPAVDTPSEQEAVKKEDSSSANDVEPAAKPKLAVESDASKDEQISPDSLRLRPHVGAELYGAQYDGTRYSEVTAHGPSTFGNYNTLNQTINHNWVPGAHKAAPVLSAPPQMSELEDIYAPTDADDQLDEVLESTTAACLTGTPGSGRFTTACAALARLHGADDVYEILLPPDGSAADLLTNPDMWGVCHGYVLRQPGGTDLRALRSFFEVLRSRSSHVLVVKDYDPRDGTAYHAEVQHSRPLSRDVFERRLVRLLKQRTPSADEKEANAFASRCLMNSQLVQALEGTQGPREAVAIAKEMAGVYPSGPSDMNLILASSQPRRRQQAAQILLPDRSGEVLRHHRIGQHERAFRIAYATFCRQPLQYVFEAAGYLLERIDTEENRGDLGRPALEHPVPELLGPLAADWHEGQSVAPSTTGGSRLAWLRDPGMRGAIIDVAWHEFDNTRPVFLEWLDRLAGEPREAARRAAAETAGLLAHHDFDRVHEDLIDRWAASPRPHLRQAAAWAVVAADLGGQVDHLVRAKVREWVSGGRNFQRDTAARVYASGLRQPHLAWSLDDLRRIAADRMQQHGGVVAEGLYQLLERHNSSFIILELGEWASNKNLARHAAYAFVAIASKAEGRHPVLLRQFVESGLPTASLIKLWQLALIEPDTSEAAWQLLVEWLGLGDADVSLRKELAELLHDLTDRPSVRRRATFYLPRLWAVQHAEIADWIETAMKER